jgi:hypothetical protein
MNFPIFKVGWHVQRSTEPNIAFLIDPNSKRFKISQKYPLSYIKLPFLDNQRVFNILLDNPRDLLADDIVKDLVEGVEGLDSSASGHACWLDDPDVVLVQLPLGIVGLDRLAELFCLCEEVLKGLFLGSL